jgi:hypothetical protein
MAAKKGSTSVATSAEAQKLIEQINAIAAKLQKVNSKRMRDVSTYLGIPDAFLEAGCVALRNSKRLASAAGAVSPDQVRLAIARYKSYQALEAAADGLATAVKEVRSLPRAQAGKDMLRVMKLGEALISDDDGDAALKKLVANMKKARGGNKGKKKAKTATATKPDPNAAPPVPKAP